MLLPQTSVLVPETFPVALTASLDSCAEIKSAPSVVYKPCTLAEFGGSCLKEIKSAPSVAYKTMHSGRVWRKLPERDKECPFSGV